MARPLILDVSQVGRVSVSVTRHFPLRCVGLRLTPNPTYVTWFADGLFPFFESFGSAIGRLFSVISGTATGVIGGMLIPSSLGSDDWNPNGPYYQNSSNEMDSPIDSFDDIVQDEYDSLEACVGCVNPLDEVEYEGKTNNQGLRDQGYTEKWTGVDQNGTYQSGFKNPKTGKWTGGHESSKNNKYW